MVLPQRDCPPGHSVPTGDLSVARRWARFSDNGYEVSSKGDTRFSALYARLRDGRTIEQAYQLDVKGYRVCTDDWRHAKGKPPLREGVDLWAEYKGLWEQWASENPRKMEDLRRLSRGKTLTDMFATTDVSQARALAEILDETEEEET